MKMYIQKIVFKTKIAMIGSCKIMRFLKSNKTIMVEIANRKLPP